MLTVLWLLKDAGGFRGVQETILLLTWHEVQDTELHMRIRSYKKHYYDIIHCPSYNNYNNTQDTTEKLINSGLSLSFVFKAKGT